MRGRKKTGKKAWSVGVDRELSIEISSRKILHMYHPLYRRWGGRDVSRVRDAARLTETKRGVTRGREASFESRRESNNGAGSEKNDEEPSKRF